jgi:FtsH-binding integral membrane protein
VSRREDLRRFAVWGERHRRLLKRVLYVFALTLVVDVMGTALMYVLERNAARSEIHGVFDAFFFSTVQLLTVSSQLPNPVTTGGRVVDIFLEIWAVFVVAGFAGAAASFFASADRERAQSGESQMTPSGGSVSSAE